MHSMGSQDPTEKLKLNSTRRRVWMAISTWLVVVVLSTAALWRYSDTPGAMADAAVQWPADFPFARVPGRDLLVMTVHPECPCSLASLSELKVLLANCDGRLTAYVLFAQPFGVKGDLETTELWDEARHVPNLTAMRDEGGLLSLRLGAKTSGQVFLYDDLGALQFSGGITESRGHAGGNEGRSAIEAIVYGAQPRTRSTPVFGCSLQ
jgi:hypothetical protein